MKNTFNLLVLIVAACFLYSCSEEPVAPSEHYDEPNISMQAYSNREFVIELKTLQSHPSDTVPGAFEMHIGGTGVISVDWGDGTIEQYSLQEEFSTQLEHQYPRIDDYTIRITGDIKQITRYSLAYQHVALDDIHLRGLPRLRDFTMVLLSEGPSTLNFSNNRLIESLNIAGLSDLSHVILPQVNKIRSIDISGEDMLSTQAVDKIINRVYHSVVANPRPGIFTLSESWAQEEGSSAMVGPPSPGAKNKLRKLRDVYGWTITPNP
jgi:hypothetical protein